MIILVTFPSLEISVLFKVKSDDKKTKYHHLGLAINRLFPSLDL